MANLEVILAALLAVVVVVAAAFWRGLRRGRENLERELMEKDYEEAKQIRRRVEAARERHVDNADDAADELRKFHGRPPD